jgi:hypothetical protein
VGVEVSGALGQAGQAGTRKGRGGDRDVCTSVCMVKVLLRKCAWAVGGCMHAGKVVAKRASGCLFSTVRGRRPGAAGAAER